jgi:hypothetical protein
MSPQDANEALEQLKSFSVNPYTLPADQQGWRGVGLPGARKRKWYTVLQNDQVLVTALFQIPGEQGCRHSHETGELSIAYVGEMSPIITWHPPTEVHGGLAYNDSRQGIPMGGELAELLKEEAPSEASTPEIATITRQLLAMQAQMQDLQARMMELLKPTPTPRIIVDVLFPPFKTTIHDPAYPGPKTIVGQWFD